MAVFVYGLRLGFLAAFFGFCFLDFKAEYIWLAAFRVYHLLAFGVMAICWRWGGAGGGFCGRLSPAVRRLLPVRHWRRLSVLPPLRIGTKTIAAIIAGRTIWQWRTDSVEPNAVLFTFDDLDLPVGYLHFVEGMRPDLKVYNDQALVYGDRLYSPLTPIIRRTATANKEC